MKEGNKTFIQTLFQKNNVIIPSGRENLFDDFVSENADSVEKSIKNLYYNWKIKNRLYDIQAQSIVLPNATVGGQYQTKLDFDKLNLTDLATFDIEIAPETGLTYNRETCEIAGVPKQSGDFKFRFLFRLKDEQTNEIHEKVLPFFVNPDPKTLWKNIPSDRSAIFWKADNAFEYGQLGEKHIVVASKRGRSHQNVGSFRDDDFSFKFIDKNGWSVVAVADGAGSYALSREGSRLACDTVIRYFSENDVLDSGQDFENKVQAFATEQDYTRKKTLEQEVEVCSKQMLYKAVLAAHKRIRDVAVEEQKHHPDIFNNPKAKTVLDYFHTTLIFALFKRYDFGYLVLSFGVGDCPIAVMNKEKTETTLLNWLDVGEFGGGTRFVTQPDIFQSKEHPMVSRFNCKIYNDFSYLFLMTDGIYDPKFVVEANLEKHEKWLEFLADLQGKNEENINIFVTEQAKSYRFLPLETVCGSKNRLPHSFCLKKLRSTIEQRKALYRLHNQKKESKKATNPAEKLLEWLDFWDKGNHDDRTLAIIY
jgi:serine/threonine protein phosphatase PrpC